MKQVCRKCGGEFPKTAEFFYFINRTRRFETRCKKCINEYQKAYQNNNADKIKTYKKEYAKENSEALTKKSVEWAKNNIEKKRRNSRRWARKFRRLYPEKHREYESKRRKNKRATDKKYALSNNMRAAIWQTIKGNKRGRTWQGLVGYTVDELKRHIEKQFTEGMSWDNYGKWHIDHAIPISVFNYETPEHEDFKRCWALENLQPLWAMENIIKNAKLDHHFQPRLLL
jgi:hypothetical protein